MSSSTSQISPERWAPTATVEALMTTTVAGPTSDEKDSALEAFHTRRGPRDLIRTGGGFATFIVLATVALFVFSAVFSPQSLQSSSLAGMLPFAAATAVVLSGASLLGGRGSFIGTMLGAALIQQILNATVFLDLSQTSQFILQGAPRSHRGVHLQPGQPPGGEFGGAFTRCSISIRSPRQLRRNR